MTNSKIFHRRAVAAVIAASSAPRVADFPTPSNFVHKANLKGNFAGRGRLMAVAREWSVEIMPDQTFVLVAEDEELVRLVIVQALLDEGFEVMEVEHAKLH